MVRSNSSQTFCNEFSLSESSNKSCKNGFYYAHNQHTTMQQSILDIKDTQTALVLSLSPPSQQVRVFFSSLLDSLAPWLPAFYFSKIVGVSSKPLPYNALGGVKEFPALPAPLVLCLARVAFDLGCFATRVASVSFSLFLMHLFFLFCFFSLFVCICLKLSLSQCPSCFPFFLA